jgi:membrane-associated phospholipid phosphatase
MFRLAAVSRALREAYPAAADPLAVAVTHLGGVTVLMVGLSLLYWLTDRRATALVVAYAFGAYAVVLGLKWFFALPRPPEAAWVVATDGYGFPSGHATAAAVVYGGIALEFDRVTENWQRAALAAVAVAVACSRVVLGVHYLSDILAGLVLGTALLAAFHYGADGDPTLAFGAAGVLGAAALSTTWGDPPVVAEVLGIVGACVGGGLATLDMDAIPHFDSRVEAAALVVVGLAFLVALQVVGDAFTGAFAGVDDAMLVGGIVLMPRLVGRAWQVAPLSGRTGA